VIFHLLKTKGERVSNFIQSGFVTLKTTLLIGALIATPVAILLAHSGATTAKPDTKVCVTAEWNANSKITSYYGDCPQATVTPTGSPTMISTPTPTPTETSVATPSPTVTATQIPEITPTETATPSPEPTETQVPAPEVTPTVTPSPTATASSAPTPTPTHTPDTIVSPTPIPTEPIVPPAPDPIPIPAANTDPKTKEFMFCHAGAMHSNSFTGMMNGHHDKHPDDIIPPIPFKFYGGWNWNSTNAKTFYNNCVPA
jgi:hypothetical protein